jgi:hypothetical protein
VTKNPEERRAGHRPVDSTKSTRPCGRTHSS